MSIIALLGIPSEMKVGFLLSEPFPTLHGWLTERLHRANVAQREGYMHNNPGLVKITRIGD